MTKTATIILFAFVFLTGVAIRYSADRYLPNRPRFTVHWKWPNADILATGATCRLWIGPVLLRLGHDAPKVPPVPKWEAVADEEKVPPFKPKFWRVRWSEPDADGRYLYVSHYGTEGIADVMARSDARHRNEQKRVPWENPDWRTEPSSKPRPESKGITMAMIRKVAKQLPPRQQGQDAPFPYRD
jgi:hypothetical protein